MSFLDRDLPTYNFGSNQAPAFCAVSTLSAFDVGANPETQVVNGLIGETTSLGNIDGNTAFLGNNTFTNGTKNVHFEAKVEKWGGGANALFGLFFLDLTAGFPPTLAGGILYIESADVYFDAQGGMPLPFAPPTFDTTVRMALYLDGNTNTLLFKDNKGNQFAPTVNPLWNPLNLVSMGGQVSSGSVLGNEVDMLLNFGSSSFAIEPQADTWCS